MAARQACRGPWRPGRSGAGLQASLVQNLAQFQNTAQTNMLQQAATQTQAYNAALAQQQAQAENLFTGL